MNSKGFTLIELIIVMAIMSIIMGIASLNFFDWSRKSQIERQTRELHTDLNTARTDSIFRKTRHSVVINSDGTGYVMKRYSSPDEAPAAGATIASRQTTYLLTKENGNYFNSDGDGIFMFNIMGTTTDLNTIRVNPIQSGVGFDCLVIHTTRTNLGRMEGGNCVPR